MGYRSEVAYIIRFKDKEMRDAFVNLERAKANKHINEALDELVEVEEDKLGFHADYVKWYDNYEDVEAHRQLLKDVISIFADEETIPDYNQQAGYRFIRLGEESDDNEVEEEGNAECLYEYVEWHRAMDVSFQKNTHEHNQKQGETA